ncbi:MAG: putative porin [Methyloglobulus sp.]
MDNKKRLLALTLCSMTSVVLAGEKEELILLRNTTINLVDELVKQGVLSEKVANDMLTRAKAEADAETKQTAQASKGENDKPDPGEVRVPYVPQFVKDEIRQQVRHELREEVVGDVMQKAKSEKWGTPDALPDWVNRFKLSGDMRLRSQNDFMADDNVKGFYSNFQAINNAGGVTAAGLDGFLNTTDDRHRFRQRLRLGIDAKVTDNLKAGIRLATSNIPDPVSTNQSLGNMGGHYDFNVDRAYLKYDAVNDEGFKWLTLSGGRIANPWYVGGGEFTGGSELVWDTDLSFEGFAATARHSLGSSGSLLDKHDASREVYATIGGFPLQETELSSHGKWLVGGQVGVDWGFNNQDALRAGIAYFDYINLEAQPNKNNPPVCNTNLSDNRFSVPQFMQFGNSVAVICNDNANDLPGLFGLASDYNIINANISYDYARFAPHHIIFAADYAKNIGFDESAVQNLAGRVIEDKTNAWQVRIDFGWPKVERASQWNVFALYKYVERDAVLDAFSDSDFHLGGTNAKGWVIGGNYGLMKNVWFTGRWLSTDVITGPKFGNDVLQLDLNAKF